MNKTMKTKKINKATISILTIMLMLLGLVSGVAGEVYPAQKTAVVLVTRYEPSPAQPGEYVDVWLKIIGFSDVDMEDFTFTLTPKYPFYLDASETAERYFGKIISGEQVVAKYRIRVDENAVEMNSLLYYEYTYKGGKALTGNVELMVRTSDADLDVESIQVENGFIEHNNPSEVIIELKNNADSLVKDITAKLDLSSDDIPIVPIGSTNEKKLYSIDGGETAQIVFNLAALSDADAMIYKVPLELSYADELDNSYSKDTIIGLAIGSEPDLSVTIESSTVVKKGKLGTVNFKIVNKGLTDIKFLNVKVKEGKDIEVAGAKEYYVGEVDSDDFENVEFKIISKKAINGNIIFPLILEYKDANNRDYMKEVDVELNLKSSQLENEKKWNRKFNPCINNNWWRMVFLQEMEKEKI